MLIQYELTPPVQICLENKVGLTVCWQGLRCVGRYTSAPLWLDAGSGVVCPSTPGTRSRQCVRTGGFDRCNGTWQPARSSPSCRERWLEKGLNCSVSSEQAPSHPENLIPQHPTTAHAWGWSGSIVPQEHGGRKMGHSMGRTAPQGTGACLGQCGRKPLLLRCGGFLQTCHLGA